MALKRSASFRNKIASPELESGFRNGLKKAKLYVKHWWADFGVDAPLYKDMDEIEAQWQQARMDRKGLGRDEKMSGQAFLEEMLSKDSESAKKTFIELKLGANYECSMSLIQAFEDNDMPKFEELFFSEKQLFFITLSEIIRHRKSQVLEAVFRCMWNRGMDRNPTDKQGRQVLDYLCSIYERLEIEVLKMLEIACFWQNEEITLDLLFEYTRVKPFDKNHLISLCEWIFAGSAHPCATALKTAGYLKSLGRHYHVSHYIEKAEYFSTMAIDLIDELDSDHIVCLLLESKHGSQNLIELGIDFHIERFFSSPKVKRCLQTMWSVPFYMRRKYIVPAEFSSHIWTLLQRGRTFLRIPFGKFFTQTLMTLGFLGYFSYVLSIKMDLPYQNGAPLLWEEVGLFTLALSYMSYEFLELLEEGPTAYFKSIWNKLDVLTHIIFLCTFTFRFCQRFEIMYPSSREGYTIGLTILSGLLWVRLSHTFAVNENLGPLIEMLMKMGGDIMNFVFLMALFLCGFGYGFFFLANSPNPDFYECGSTDPAEHAACMEGEEGIPAFTDMTTTFFTMYQGFIGELGFDWFDNIQSASTQSFAKIWLCVYVLVSMIMLLNLLVAMMSETYRRIQTDSRVQYNFGRACMTWEYSEKNSELPPPLNIVGNFIALLLSPFLTPRLNRWVSSATKEEKREALQSELGHLAVCDNLIQEAYDDVVPDDGLEPLTTHDVFVMENGASEAEQTKLAQSRQVIYNIWICHHCHFKNVFIFNSIERIRKSLSVWTKEKRRLADLDEEMNLLDSTIVVCNECLRFKDPVTVGQLHREQVASILFWILIALPLASFLTFPAIFYGLWQLVQASFEADAKEREDEAKKEAKGGKVMLEAHQASVKERVLIEWVMPRFAEVETNPSDVLRYLMHKMGGERIDPHDGAEKTEEEFLELYGKVKGAEYWSEAHVVKGFDALHEEPLVSKLDRHLENIDQKSQLEAERLNAEIQEKKNSVLDPLEDPNENGSESPNLA